MLRSVRVAVPWGLCASIGVLAFSFAVFQGVSRGGLPQASEPSGVSPEGFRPQLAVGGMRWLMGDEQSRADERSALVNPEAVAARVASRTEYKGLGAAAAAKLLA